MHDSKPVYRLQQQSIRRLAFVPPYSVFCSISFRCGGLSIERNQKPLAPEITLAVTHHDRQKQVEVKRSSRVNPHEIRLLSGCPYYFTLPIAKARIVVVAADTRIKANTVNDLLGVQTLTFCIGIQFIEVSNTQSQIGICEQLDRLGLSEAHEQRVNVLFDCTFLSERPDMERVFLCLDSDKAGEDACKRLAALLPETMSVTRIQPCMKDWNDVLVHRAEIPNRNYFKSTVLKEPPKKDSVKIIRMSDVKLTPVEWLWKPYLPFGKLSVLQGNPGEGKTYFAMHLAAACTNGKLLPNMERLEPFNVIYQTAEDGLGDTVKPRLIEAGADLDRVLVIDDSEVQLTLSDERIEKAIIENNARLVIIDPIQAYLGADVDMNRANEVRPIFMRLGQVAQRTGCAILLIGHLNKAAGMQSLQRGLGSIDIAAAVRSVMFIGKLKHDPTMRILTHEKSSLAPPGASLAFSLGDKSGFHWVGEYDITADEMLSGIEPQRETKTQQAKDLICTLLAGGKRVYSEDIDKAALERGIPGRTVRDAKRELGDALKSKIVEGRRKVFWMESLTWKS